MKCVAMEGLVEESKELLEEIDKGAVLDAALIGAAQNVEHYEIASYGTLITMAKHLKLEDAATLLSTTLFEQRMGFSVNPWRCRGTSSHQTPTSNPGWQAFHARCDASRV